MKTRVLFLMAFMMVSIYSSNAQVIPNYNFENWSNGDSSAPDGWADHGNNNQGTGYVPASKSTDHYLGNYSLHLENKIFDGDTTRGIVNSIRPNAAPDAGPGSAFPISKRYKNMKGYYKFSPDNGDSAVIMSFLFKSGFANSQMPGMLGVTWITFGKAVSTWTPFSTDGFYYFDANAVPDIAWIQLSSYQDVNFATRAKMYAKGNSALYVDALNYDSYITGINENMNITNNFKMYSNPNNGNFDVSFETASNDYTTIRIYNMDGKEIMNLYSGNLNSGTHSFHYALNELQNGNYLYMISSAKGYKVEKLVIQK